jgi:hypothetical protein
MAGSGSKAVTPVLPSEAITMHGVSPAAISVEIACSSAAGSIAYVFGSVATIRTLSAPNPANSAAFITDE